MLTSACARNKSAGPLKQIGRSDEINRQCRRRKFVRSRKTRHCIAFIYIPRTNCCFVVVVGGRRFAKRTSAVRDQKPRGSEMSIITRHHPVVLRVANVSGGRQRGAQIDKLSTLLLYVLGSQVSESLGGRPEVLCGHCCCCRMVGPLQTLFFHQLFSCFHQLKKKANCLSLISKLPETR